MTDKNANTEIRKEFCPNCEKDTECIHAAELYECQECGDDFAKYIVPRTAPCTAVNEPSNSDVSMTQDVLTDIKTPRSIENNNPDYYKQELARIAEFSQAVGLITTLKPTMVMDAEHPLDMAKEAAEYVTVRIAELEHDLTNKEIEYTDLWDDALAFQSRIAELEAENERLSQLLHDEMSQLEIATDLGNKRWTALNKIYEHGEKHNTNWCKRIAQEGLGIK